MKKTIRKTMMFALTITLAFIAFSLNAKAATFTVNTTADTQDLVAGDGVCLDSTATCSLRAAITEANALAGPDIITLPAGTYTETLVAAAENVNAGGDFDITSDITINGAAAATTIVQSNAAPGVATERVFHIRGVAAATTLTVNINNLTVQNGRNSINAFGGGIRIDQGTNHNVILSDLTVTNNRNDSSGGGLSISGATTPTVTITNCTFSNNRAGSATAATSATGGGIQINVSPSTTNISGTTITGNTATTSVAGINPTGAGISSLGTTMITNSLITNNAATTATGTSQGGGVSVGGGTATINFSNIANNFATVTAGAGNTFGAGLIAFAGTVTLTGNTVLNNNTSNVTGGTGLAFAGGIYSQQATLNITNSIVTGNTASNTPAPANAVHGGIRVLAQTIAATTNITNSTISNNSSAGEGGGIINISVGAASSIITITGSTISGNSATAATSLAGGIENFSTSTGAATVNLTNSTVSGNSANNAAGIYSNGAVATINLNYATVASNTATANGGGLYQDVTAGGSTKLKNTIVADNTAGTGPDIFGTITSQDYNHVENTAGGAFAPLANDVTGSDPQLGPLAFNSGTTQNHLPAAASPVVNTIPSGTSDCGTTVTVDQRGIVRPQANFCEKGSDERFVPTAANATISGQITTPNGTPLAGAVVNLIGTQLRKTITDVQGNYRFDNVETSGFYTVTPSQLNYSFSPVNRSFSQLGNHTEAAFTAFSTVERANQLDTPEYFVRQQYLDFLGREPDESGFNFWSDQIMSCGSDSACIERRTINVSAAYFLSIEFQKTGGLVDGLYRASYGRAPRYAEFMPDTAEVAQGVVVGPTDWAGRLAANKDAFVNAWVQRAEFRAAYDGLTNSAFVDTLIARAGVGFNGGDEVRAALVSGLNNGTLTRAAALRQVVENEGFVAAKSNKMFVMMEYFGYLRRDPDDSGYQFWLKKLNDFNGNFEQAEMVKAFIVSGEYRNRFRQ
jgi:CSLREA domain-containing protein